MNRNSFWDLGGHFFDTEIQRLKASFAGFKDLCFVIASHIMSSNLFTNDNDNWVFISCYYQRVLNKFVYIVNEKKKYLSGISPVISLTKLGFFFPLRYSFLYLTRPLTIHSGITIYAARKSYQLDVRALYTHTRDYSPKRFKNQRSD